MEVFYISEENELDTYMSREVLVLEGNEPQSLTREELDQGQEDHSWFNHGSTCTISVSLKSLKMFWFLDQAIWREEQKPEYDPKKPVEECEDPECRNHAIIRVSQIKEQLEVVKEEVKNTEVVMAILNGLPGSWDSFIRGMCARRKWLILVDSGKRRWEQLKIKLLPSKVYPSSNEEYEELNSWRTSYPP